MAGIGVSIVDNVSQLKGGVVVISSHGVGPKVIEEIKSRNIEIVDTTCPFVKRAQVAARRLAGAGFFTIVFGDVDHPEKRAYSAGLAKGCGYTGCNNLFNY